jgi:hypothetical protein
MCERGIAVNMLETLREAIRKSGATPYELEQRTGVLRGSTLRFLKGVHVLRFDKAAALAEHLGLELRPKASGQKRGR